jgi:hypothetical protein
MDKIWSWILVWTYNPPGLKGRSVTQRREYLWMSKAVLQSRFGSKDRGAAGAGHGAPEGHGAGPAASRGLEKPRPLE